MEIKVPGLQKFTEAMKQQKRRAITLHCVANIHTAHGNIPFVPVTPPPFYFADNFINVHRTAPLSSNRAR
jgi:hypothetical protein